MYTIKIEIEISCNLNIVYFSIKSIARSSAITIKMYKSDAVLKQNDIRWIIEFDDYSNVLIFVGCYKGNEWTFTTLPSFTKHTRSYRRAYGQLQGNREVLTEVFNNILRNDLFSETCTIIFPKIYETDKEIFVILNPNDKHEQTIKINCPENYFEDVDARLFTLAYNHISTTKILMQQISELKKNNTITNTRLNRLEENEIDVNDVFTTMHGLVNLVCDDDKLIKVKKIIRNIDC